LGIKKQWLSGLPLAELTALLHPLPRFRAAQIFERIARGARSFDEMSSLPRTLREKLADSYSLYTSAVDRVHEAPDSTVKIAVRLEDGAKIEAVLLADERRHTACLSTQAGCPAGCVFCKTGSLGFLRNLNSAEIVEQLLFLRGLAARQDAGEERDTSPRQDAAEERPINNIVIMGMGEPLLNLAELRRALAVITDPLGLGFSKRRVTISTCGIADGIADLADTGPDVRLALSLTTADPELRKKLMPITAAHPLEAVREALVYFQQKGGGRVTLEAALLGGVNTRAEDAAAMARFARGLETVVNLIPWNPVPGCSLDGKALREPSPAEVTAFARQLEALGLKVTRRFRKGRGVTGACGQLGLLPHEAAEQGLKEPD
jgi:23S rRNA (adenine2503-C2)-methyltransferase